MEFDDKDDWQELRGMGTLEACRTMSSFLKGWWWMEAVEFDKEHGGWLLVRNTSLGLNNEQQG